MIRVPYIISFLFLYTSSAFCQTEPVFHTTTSTPSSYNGATGNGASEVLQDKYSGKLYQVTSNYDAVGSPMLFDDWKSSTIILNNGSEFNNTMVKYNVLRNKFLFHRNDSTFEFLDDVAEIRMKDDNLNDIVFKKITNAEIKAKEGSYVQVWSEGKFILYNHYTRTMEGEN